MVLQVSKKKRANSTSMEVVSLCCIEAGWDGDSVTGDAGGAFDDDVAIIGLGR